MPLTTLISSLPLSTANTAPAITPSTVIQIQSDPTSRDFVSQAGSLNSCKSLREIRQWHARFTKQGLVHETTALEKLIVKYSQMGSSESLEYAEKAFNQLKNINEDCSTDASVYVYNSLIKGNSVAGFFEEAFLWFLEMVDEGVVPDNYTFPFVLSVCAKSLKLFEGMQLHGAIVKLGFDDDPFVSNSLIHFYGECDEIDQGRKVFDEMPERNVVSWTSLICGYARRNLHEEAVSVFFKMVESGIAPNEVTMTSVISACAELGDLALGERVSSYVGMLGLTLNAIMVNALVHMYMKCGAVDHAKRLFDEHVERNLVLYNTLMSGYEQLGKVKEALSLLCEMHEEGIKPDRVTMLSAISCSAELGELGFGRQCHAHVLRNGLERWGCVGNSLIDMYTKCGMQEWAGRVFDSMHNKTIVSWNSLLAGFGRNDDMQLAKKMFMDMPERNLVSWNTMIGSLVLHSFFWEAIELFHSMQKEGIKPNEVTMVSIASACGYLGALDLARWIYNYIERSGILCDMQLSTALIDMFARCGDPKTSMRVFRTMKKKDVSAWTAAIGAMAMEGNGDRALELFDEMLRQGVEPDKVVFSGILTACSHSGLVEKGMHVFKSMKEHGITPHIVHYGCLIDLLGRAGLLDEALDEIKSMPVQPNREIWSAFLAACRVHKNQTMARIAAEKLSESENEEAGNMVLLSNIYASAGRWDEVAKVRMHMKEKGMRKTPGSSSIEVNGGVYEFMAGDESHQENGISNALLEEINCRFGGYVPDLTNVLLDVYQ